MPIVSLRDLYIAELQDLFDAEQHNLLELPNIARVATSAALRELFDTHLEETRVHTERLELLFRKLDVPAQGAPCEAMHGLIKEGRRRIEACERGDVLDAALIGIAQRIEHYEIASYGCARSYARTLGDHEAANLLQQTLDEEGAANARLTKIAERGINQSAGEDLRSDTDAQRARLRYLPAASLREFRYREFRIRNTANEDLGSLDGLIVDSRTHRPEYFVVDSGGWFVGQRFLVPIDALRVDAASQTLRTDLDRKAIEACPPFNPDAFLGPSTDAKGVGRTDDEYRPPTWLMTGVWMTDASGFACVPPRAQSDFTSPAEASRPSSDTYPETEQMVAREKPERRDDG
jgi:ferritin-like metal-binding protein YciE